MRGRHRRNAARGRDGQRASSATPLFSRAPGEEIEDDGVEPLRPLDRRDVAGPGQDAEFGVRQEAVQLRRYVDRKEVVAVAVDDQRRRADTAQFLRRREVLAVSV